MIEVFLIISIPIQIFEKEQGQDSLPFFIVDIYIWLAFKIPGLKVYIKWAQLELKS